MQLLYVCVCVSYWLRLDKEWRMECSGSRVGWSSLCHSAPCIHTLPAPNLELRIFNETQQDFYTSIHQQLLQFIYSSFIHKEHEITLFFCHYICSSNLIIWWMSDMNWYDIALLLYFFLIDTGNASILQLLEITFLCGYNFCYNLLS